MADRREWSQLIGEAVRDGAVLIGVLWPLEDGIANHGHLDTMDFVLAEAFACILMCLGLILEGRDEL